MPKPAEAPRRAAIVGGGVIGGGWAARFALMGWDVAVFDPGPEARDRLEAVLDRARRSLPGLSDSALPPEGRVTFAATLQEAVAQADWVQESVPERLGVKHATLAAIQQACLVEAIIGSSTSGFTPTQLQQGSARPGQILVAHPFNPVYLLPLVEVVGSPATAPETLDRAETLLSGLGMYPLRVRAEIDAHIADRLLESVWREALWLVRDGIATTAEIDEAIRMGFGLRWAQMGLFETYRIAGGADGMAHFLSQFGPALKWPWTRLMDVPELDAALVETIAAQSDAQSGHMDIATLERTRDDNLVTLLRGLKARDQAAGAVLNAQDRRLDRLPQTLDAADLTAPVPTIDRAVPLDWTDYNGHMTEARYLHAFGEATDRLMRLVGCTDDYVAAGHSFFAAETHIRHLDEVHAGTRIQIDTQVLEGAGRKMHLFHRMWAGERLLATGEHMLIHVSLESRRACAPLPQVADPLGRLAQAHAVLARPDGVGRAVGRK